MVFLYLVISASLLKSLGHLRACLQLAAQHTCTYLPESVPPAMLAGETFLLREQSELPNHCGFPASGKSRLLFMSHSCCYTTPENIFKS